MVIPISSNGRRFGYFIWPKSADAEMKEMLGGLNRVQVSFQGIDIGERTIDWGHRRISLGPAQTQRMPDTATSFVLERCNTRINLTYK